MKLLILTSLLFSLPILAAKNGSKTKDEKLLNDLRQDFEPIKRVIIDTKDQGMTAKIKLGKKLYFEKKLSANNTISCNSCHDITKKYGVDNLPTSPGHKGQLGDRNSPTVLNAVLHIAQFWDGRAENLEAQAIGPILNPVEMAMGSENEVLEKLSKEQSYMEQFKKAFPNEKTPLTYKNIGNAIGAFERTLVTPSRFDQFLEGDLKALTKEEKKGARTFATIGCTACHSGPGVGGGMYQKIGLVEEFKTQDLGRFKVTKVEDDKKVFKVPSLRNVHMTSPYFHDGSVKTLDEAIKLMARHQLGYKISEAEVKSIKTFLGSLTAELPNIKND